MSCECLSRPASDVRSHNFQLRTERRCRCGCHDPKNAAYQRSPRDCASCGKPGSWDLCRDCGGR